MFGLIKRWTQEARDQEIKSSRTDYENQFIQKLLEDLQKNYDNYTSILNSTAEKFIVRRDHNVLIYSAGHLGKPFKAYFTSAEQEIVDRVKAEVIQRDTEYLLKDFWK